MRFRIGCEALALLVLTFCALACADSTPRREKCNTGKGSDGAEKCQMTDAGASLRCHESNLRQIPDDAMINAIEGGASTGGAYVTQLFVNMTCLVDIQEGDLRPFIRLQSFSAARNFLTQLHGNTFADNGDLRFIDLSCNGIKEIHHYAFVGLKNLEELRLNDNLLTVLDGDRFEGVEGIKVLVLDNNRMPSIRFRDYISLTNLETLSLRGNKISSIEDASFKNTRKLTHLHLDDNNLLHIRERALEGLHQLQVLTLSYNNIIKWPENYGFVLRTLQTLHLDHNAIREFKSRHLANLQKLQILSLANNSLTKLDEDAFAPVCRLQFLNLSSNYLTSIPKNTFTHLRHLETLSISKNRLATPQAEWFWYLAMNPSGDPYGHSDLRFNLWDCTCDAIPYKEQMEYWESSQGNTEIRQKLQIQCTAPKFAENEILDDNLIVEIKERLKCEPTLPPLAASSRLSPQCVGVSFGRIGNPYADIYNADSGKTNCSILGVISEENEAAASALTGLSGGAIAGISIAGSVVVIGIAIAIARFVACNRSRPFVSCKGSRKSYA